MIGLTLCECPALALKSGHAALHIAHLEQLNIALRALPRAPTVGAWPDLRANAGHSHRVNRP